MFSCPSGRTKVLRYRYWWTSLLVDIVIRALPVECPQDVERLFAHALLLGTLGHHDRPDALDARLELIVDHDVIVLLEHRHFFARDLEPLLDRRVAVFTAPAKPFFEHLVGR